MTQLSNMRRTIENYGGSDISPYLKAAKLTSCSFLGGDRRHVCAESETKYFITHGTIKCVNFPFAWGSRTPSCQVPQCWCGADTGKRSIYNGCVSQPKNAEHRIPTLLKDLPAKLSHHYSRGGHFLYHPGQKSHLSFSPEGDLFVPSKVACYINNLGKIVPNKRW